MQIPVAIEQLGDGQFRAHSFPPFKSVAEGRTRDEAIVKVRDELNKEIAAGKVVIVDVPTKEENPWLKMAGSLKDNPLYDEWRAEVEAYRRQCDVEAGIDVEAEKAMRCHPSI